MSDWPDLAYTRAGSGEPLLLLHSLGGSRVIWEPVMHLLAAEYDVIAVDMPGFGDSPKLPRGIEPSPVNLARAALAQCERIGVGGPVHVSGVSLGGWVSIECSRLGSARSVTGLCTAGFWDEPLGPRINWARILSRLALPFLRPTLTSEKGRRRALSGVIRHPDRVTPEQARRLVEGYATSPGFNESNSLMRGATILPWERASAPVTLGWAEHDTLVRSRPLADHLLPEGVRQVVLPGCGHLPTWDDPALVARTIGETIAEATAAVPTI